MRTDTCVTVKSGNWNDPTVWRRVHAMSTRSSIEWTDATWNPIVGCSKVSPGCAHCYAERMAGRLAAMGQRTYQDVVAAPDTRYGPRSRWNGKTTLVESALHAPLRWRKPKRVFVCSMSDLFHEANQTDWIDRVFAVMALCPQHTFQVLTKRPERMAEYLANATRTDNLEEEIARQCGWEGRWPKPTEGDWPLPNVWLGTSVEDQQRADERIPHLLRCPAAVRFLSVEPLLGDINLDRTNWMYGDCRDDGHQIDWVIVGGESGPNARPCNVEWIRSIVRQCAEAAVPCFVKQLGALPVGLTHVDSGPAFIVEHGEPDLKDVPGCTLHDPKGGDPSEWPADLRVREWPAVAVEDKR